MKLLPLSAIATLGIAALSLLTSCQDEDFGYTSEDVRAGVYDRNFIKHYGEIPANQSWDFSSFGLISRLEAARNQSLTRGTNDFTSNGGTWCSNEDTQGVSLTYDSEKSFTETHDLIQWIKKRLQENGKRVDGIQTNKEEFNQRFSMISAENGFSFSVMPVFQGIDNTVWDFHALIEWEDAEGHTQSIDKVLWKKSEGMYMMGERPDLDGETIHDYVDHYVKVSDLSVLTSNQLSTESKSGQNQNNVTPNNNILYETTRLASDIKTHKATVTGNVGTKANITFYLHVLKRGDSSNNTMYYSDGRENENQSSSNIVVLPIQVDIPGYTSNDVVLMGCETAEDNDMNDIVFLLIGEPTLPELVNHNIISKRYFFEDLGSVVDWDFNDVVLDMSQVIEFENDKKYITQKATLKHRCGTTPFDLYLKDADGNFTELNFSSLKEDGHIPGVNEGTAMDITETITLLNKEEYTSSTVCPWRHADNNVAIKVYPSLSPNRGVEDGTSNEGTWAEFHGRYQEGDNHYIPRVFIADVNVWWTDEGDNFPNMWAHPEETIITKPAGAADNEQHAGSLIGIGSNRGTRYPYLDGDKYMLWNNPTQFIQWEPLWLSEGFIEGLQQGYTTVNIEFGDCNTSFAMLFREDYTKGDTKYTVDGKEFIGNQGNTTYPFTIPATGNGSVEYFTNAVSSGWSPSFGIQGYGDDTGDKKIIINKVYLTRSGSGNGGSQSGGNQTLTNQCTEGTSIWTGSQSLSWDNYTINSIYSSVNNNDILHFHFSTDNESSAKVDIHIDNGWSQIGDQQFELKNLSTKYCISYKVTDNGKLNQGIVFQGQNCSLTGITVVHLSTDITLGTLYNFEVKTWDYTAKINSSQLSNINVGDKLIITLKDVKNGAQLQVSEMSGDWSNKIVPNDNLNGATSKEIEVTSSNIDAIKHGLGIQGHDFTFEKVDLLKGSVDNTPTELITNGDLEGSNYGNFKYTDAKANQWSAQAPIVDSQDGHGKIAQITAQRTDSNGDSWNTKFTINLDQSLPAGTNLKIRFDYKASDGSFNISLGTNDSDGKYAEYISEVSFSNSWQTFEKTITTTKELKQIEMSLATQDGNGKTFSFDNISVIKDPE